MAAKVNTCAIARPTTMMSVTRAKSVEGSRRLAISAARFMASLARPGTRQRLAHEVEAVLAPIELAVDDVARRAEDLRGDCSARVGLVLRGDLVAQGFFEPLRRQAALLNELRKDGRAGDVALLGPHRGEHRGAHAHRRVLP